MGIWHESFSITRIEHLTHSAYYDLSVSAYAVSSVAIGGPNNNIPEVLKKRPDRRSLSDFERTFLSKYFFFDKLID